MTYQQLVIKGLNVPYSESRKGFTGIGGDVERHVAACKTCNQHKKPNHRNKHRLIQYNSGIPMESVHIDFMGTLSKTKQGNPHVIDDRSVHMVGRNQTSAITNSQSNRPGSR